MSSFDANFDRLLDIEGRGYSNYSSDRGGPTRFGITLALLSRWRKRTCIAEDVESLQEPEARAIYRAFFWDALKLDQVKSSRVRAVLFDQVVNCGQRLAVMRAQRALGLPVVDGVLGPITMAALNAENDQLFCIEFVKLSQLHYAKLVRRCPTQSLFIEGWIKRTHQLLDVALSNPSERTA